MSSFIITQQLPSTIRGGTLSDLLAEGYNERSFRNLQRVSEERVRQITVLRDPVPESMEAMIDAISSGRWTELKHEYGFDKFYHLALVINGHILIEKNAYGININEYTPYKAESIDVPRSSLSRISTVWAMLDNTEKALKDNYFSYSPFRNNCQNFIYNFLQSNGVLDDQLAAFVYQPIDELVAKLSPFVEPVVDIASRAYGLQSLAQLEGTGPARRRFHEDVTVTFQPGEIFHHDTNASNFPELYNKGNRRFIWFYKLGSSAGHGAKRFYFKLKDHLTLYNLDSAEGLANFLRILKSLNGGDELVNAFKEKIKSYGSEKERPKYITASGVDQMLAHGLAKNVEDLGASGWKLTMAGSTADPEYLVIDPKIFFDEPYHKKRL